MSQRWFLTLPLCRVSVEMESPSLELRRVQLAQRMLELSIRPHLVSYTLGMPRALLVRWWQSLYGEKPKRGPMPAQVASYIKSRSDARKLSVFLGILSRHGKCVSADGLVESIEAYNSLYPSSTINGNMAWQASREFSSEVLTLRYCPSCRVRHAYQLSTKILRNCTFCGSAS